MKERTIGLPPLSRCDARILILGTLPGAESLRRGEYYANKGNAFWKIAGAIIGFSPEIDYGERVAKLIEARIALWDVCQSANRTGSLDSTINTEICNDIVGFLDNHRDISMIAFNGRKAFDLYVVNFPRDFSNKNLHLEVLPSTSPLNTHSSFLAKREGWRAALDPERILA